MLNIVLIASMGYDADVVECANEIIKLYSDQAPITDDYYRINAMDEEIKVMWHRYIFNIYGVLFGGNEYLHDNSRRISEIMSDYPFIHGFELQCFEQAESVVEDAVCRCTLCGSHKYLDSVYSYCSECHNVEELQMGV